MLPDGEVGFSFSWELFSFDSDSCMTVQDGYGTESKNFSYLYVWNFITDLKNNLTYEIGWSQTEQ